MAEKVYPEWEKWGRLLLRQRRLSGKNQTEAARAINQTRQQIGKFEKGTRIPSRDIALALDDRLGTGGVLVQLWDEISEAPEVPDEWQNFFKLERAARVIRERSGELVPGLLQCPSYARVLFRRGMPGATEEQIEGRVVHRTSRLGELHRSPMLYFVVEELAFRRYLGAPEVMVEQIDHLLSLIELPVVHVSLVPIHAPHRPAVNGCFRVMSLDGGRQVAHVEHALGDVVISRAESVQRLLEWFGELQAEALPPTASANLLRKIKEELL